MPKIEFLEKMVRFEYIPASSEPKGNLVFLHTIGLTLHESDGLLSYFQEFNILRYDLFGHGESELPFEYVTVEHLVIQLKLLTQQFFEKKF